MALPNSVMITATFNVAMSLLGKDAYDITVYKAVSAAVDIMTALGQ